MGAFAPLHPTERRGPDNVFTDWRSPDFTNLIEAVRREKKLLALTNGCFDLLHAGHIALLESAKSNRWLWPEDPKNFLLVALNSDASVKRLKGIGRPYLSFTDRARMLAAVRYVDAVVGFDEDTPEALIAHVTPTVLVKGAEYKDRDVPGARHSKFLMWVPMAGELHTTELLRRIREASS